MSNPNDSYSPKSGKIISPSGEVGNLYDEVTKSSKIITTDHSFIHDSKAYTVFNKYTIAAGASAYMEFIIPSDSYVHFKPVSMQSDSPKILIQLIEAPVITTGLTGITPVNRRRLGTPTPSLVTVHSNPTGVSGGTVIDQDYIGGGTGAGASSVSGGMASNENEWVLEQATSYVVKVTNNGSASADVNIKAFWYEEEAG